jgi:hypothetical protein
MAFTRFHDDPDVIQKKLSESVFSGIYQLNTPGNGINNPYIDDVSIRLQGWGANLHTNTIDLDSSFKGLDRKLTCDYLQYSKPKTNAYSYSTKSFLVDETRVTHPAWLYRDLTHHRPSYLLHNPQTNLELIFKNNEPTRTLEKDSYNKNNCI